MLLQQTNKHTKQLIVNNIKLAVNDSRSLVRLNWIVFDRNTIFVSVLHETTNKAYLIHCSMLQLDDIEGKIPVCCSLFHSDKVAENLLYILSVYIDEAIFESRENEQLR